VAPDQRSRISLALTSLEMNTLFARAVVDERAPGRVFEAATGSAFYVVHDYGMSLLAGNPDQQVLAEVVCRPRAADEWLQVAPNGWAVHVTRVATSAVERSTRVNFTFSAERYRARRAELPRSPHAVVRADAGAFEMRGSVVPRHFWRTAEHFLRDGLGFAVVDEGAVVSLAFSSFVIGRAVEIGIETLPAHRGRGLATVACAALIDDCLARGVEPVWACRLENTASHRLAETLGFVPVRQLPYFRLRGSTA